MSGYAVFVGLRFANPTYSFRRLITGDDEEAELEELYNGQKILFSSARDLPEDDRSPGRHHRFYCCWRWWDSWSVC